MWCYSVACSLHCRSIHMLLACSAIGYVTIVIYDMHVVTIIIQAEICMRALIKARDMAYAIHEGSRDHWNTQAQASQLTALLEG